MHPPSIPVWDGVVRLLHWSLAVTIAINLVRDDGDYLHRLVGYIAVIVVLSRLAWSLVARHPGNLGALRPSPARTLAYLDSFRHGRPPRSLGHNPLGIWMVWLTWSLVLLLGLTGWMSRLDAFWGNDTVHAVHAILADLLLIAVGLHVAAIAGMSMLWRENLPSAMVTGRKPRPESDAPRVTAIGDGC